MEQQRQPLGRERKVVSGFGFGFGSGSAGLEGVRVVGVNEMAVAFWVWVSG